MKVDSVYDMFERMEKKTGIKITPHMLRRYYANTRWEADWPLEMISQALGHKHLDTTIRYLNVLDDKLREASQEFYRRYSNPVIAERYAYTSDISKLIWNFRVEGSNICKRQILEIVEDVMQQEIRLQECTYHLDGLKIVYEFCILKISDMLHENSLIELRNMQIQNIR